MEGVYEHEKESFATFLYNKNEGTVMGRTGGSWGRIGIFYLIFYTFLAGWFSVMMAVFYKTLDTETYPKYLPGPRDDGSLGGSILQNPAMGYLPKPRAKNVESTLVWYKQSDLDDVDFWANSLKTFIKDYEQKSNKQDGQTLIDCHDASGNQIATPTKEQACIFRDSALTSACQKEDKFGYANGKPCIIVKMNKMINWVPHVYEKGSDVDHKDVKDVMPQSLKDHIKAEENRTNGVLAKRIWLSCEGENPADVEYVGPIEMYPHRGFDAVYFPYRHVAGYMNPLVAVVFTNPTPHVLINIQCRAWAKNIKHVPGKRLGIVHFELLLD